MIENSTYIKQLRITTPFREFKSSNFEQMHGIQVNLSVPSGFTYSAWYYVRCWSLRVRIDKYTNMNYTFSIELKMFCVQAPIVGTGTT